MVHYINGFGHVFWFHGNDWCGEHGWVKRDAHLVQAAKPYTRDRLYPVLCTRNRLIHIQLRNRQWICYSLAKHLTYNTGSYYTNR
jgi:hypothetical protein